MQALIYRALYLSEVADFNTQAAGCHWSFNESVDEVVEAGCLSLSARTGNTLILFRTKVGGQQINWDATVYSNTEHGHEYECVLNFDERVEVEYRDEQGEWLTAGSASVGQAGHAWVASTDSASQAEISLLISDLKEWATIED